MAYLTAQELQALGFKSLGKNIKISTKCSVYDPEKIALGDNVRIDDFCILSGRLELGNYVHIAPMTILSGGRAVLRIGNYCTTAYGVKIFAQSDDYSGNSLTNTWFDLKYKNELVADVTLNDHVIIGAGSVVQPGVELGEGTAVGSMSLVREDTAPWSIYAGIPAVKLKERSQEVLKLIERFKAEQSSDCI